MNESINLLHLDLFKQWQDKLAHYKSLLDDSPQKVGAELNMKYAKGEWEKAVLESAGALLRELNG